jgi:hypothetical protein
MSRLQTLASLLLLGTLVSGCADATGVANGTPPVLPEVESMEFDIDFFQSGGAGPSAAGPLAVAGLNWTAAALSVATANLAVVIHTVVPVATWRAARLQTPVFEDGQWHWRFSTSEGGQTYGGDLTGYTEDGDLIAEMRITASVLGLQDFLWYTGTAPLGGTTGEWIFFDPQAPSTVAGRIDWSHPGTGVWTLAFTAVSGPDAGDELAYDVDVTSRTVTFVDASAGTTAEVHWDSATLTGYIIAPNYNGGLKACWDGTLANVACPT